MKSLKWQIGAACFATVSAVLIACLWWWTLNGVWFAAGMVFASWMTVLDHWCGDDTEQGVAR